MCNEVSYTQVDEGSGIGKVTFGYGGHCCHKSINVSDIDYIINIFIQTTVIVN